MTWGAVLKDAGDDLPVIIENIFEETPATLIALLDHLPGKEPLVLVLIRAISTCSPRCLESWLAPLKGRLKEDTSTTTTAEATRNTDTNEGVAFPGVETSHEEIVTRGSIHRGGR